jgi:polysaccharide pyruvyl transferase WcaK-like protein
MKKRILTWGWFGFHNFGDDLLLYTFIKNVTSSCSDIVLSIAMNEKYDLDENINQVERSYKTLFSANRYDVLIIGPGGIFPKNKTLKLLLYYFILIRWKIAGRKIVFFGTGISNYMNGLQRNIWRRIVKLSDLFLTRSSSFLKTINISENVKIHSMPDSVFSLDLPENDYFEKTTKKIGIVVANLTSDVFAGQVYQNQVSIWEEVVRQCLHRGKTIDLIAFTKGNDDRLIDDIAKKYTEVNCIHYKEIERATGKWNQYEAIIAMRFHSIVLSVMNCIPFVPIAYGYKAIDLVERIGLSKYALKWSLSGGYSKNENNIEASDIIKQLDYVLEERERILDLLQKTMTELKQSSDKSYSELNSFIFHL